MKDRIPSLNGLKTLESAGRLMSFARAAEELCVTPGAVSRQIRTLEDLLGFQLFDRNHREVRLTPEAKEYVDSLGECFRQMERATYRLTKTHRHQALHVHCAFTFALRWLMPRLVGFHARHPHQEIRLATRHANNEELASSDHINLQIKTESVMAELAPALIGHRLMDIEIVPVCSPTLLGPDEQVGDKSIFRNHTLLHSNVRRKDWEEWLINAGIADADPESGIVFESSTLS
jgi:LysR family glycine cleavage system transcriptional activator